MKGISSYYQNERIIFFTAACISVLLSIWSACSESVINPDAICYLLSAEAIARSGWFAVIHNTCPQANWPFYSILIFALSHVVSLSYLVSAYLLDGLFSLISVITFICIVKELGGSTRVLYLAMLVILASHEFNSVRQYIVRDHGYWAFYLLSVFFLLKYARNVQWVDVCGFYLSLLIATLFRIEGVIFLLVVPFVFLLLPSLSFQQRLKCFITLYTPLFIICFVLAVWYLLHSATTHFGRLLEVIYQIRHGLILMLASFQSAKIGLAQHVLAPEAARDAGMLLFLGLVIWYIVYAMINLSWGYVCLVIYACYHRVMSYKQDVLWIISTYLLVNVGITFVFFTQHLFLSKRYLIALSLMFMLFVPFALDTLCARFAEYRARVFLIFSIFFIIFSTIGGIVNFGYSKNYIREAGDWIVHHVPDNASLYVNDYQLMYYSKHFNENIFQIFPIYLHINILQNEQWKQYDYLALRLDKQHMTKAMSFISLLRIKPEKLFVNRRGDGVVIYKTREKMS